MLYNWLQHIDFAYPGMFALLLIIPLMIAWYIKKHSAHQATLLVSSALSFSRQGSWRTALRHTLFIFRLLTVFCLVVALARPQTRNDEQLISGEGVDIMLCMDISGSMMAQDFTPNRLEAMKSIVADFVDKRPTDRIGLVIFAGESFTASPMTMDRTSLKAQIFNAQSDLLADGTAIGDGLASSVERLKDSKAKSRVIIFLTDGEDQGGLIDPRSAKEIAKSVGVKVYTIRMGTDGFASPQPETAEGAIQPQKANINETLLREIASETGGLYFRARDNNGLQSIYREIDKLEKSTIEISALKRFSEKFLPFAIAAAVLLLAEIIMRHTVFRKFP